MPDRMNDFMKTIEGFYNSIGLGLLRTFLCGQRSSTDEKETSKGKK